VEVDDRETIRYSDLLVIKDVPVTDCEATRVEGLGVDVHHRRSIPAPCL